MFSGFMSLCEMPAWLTAAARGGLQQDVDGLPRPALHLHLLAPIEQGRQRDP
jgi:hypothetical protein